MYFVIAVVTVFVTYVAETSGTSELSAFTRRQLQSSRPWWSPPVLPNLNIAFDSEGRPAISLGGQASPVVQDSYDEEEEESINEAENESESISVESSPTTPIDNRFSQIVVAMPRNRSGWVAEHNKFNVPSEALTLCSKKYGTEENCEVYLTTGHRANACVSIGANKGSLLHYFSAAVGNTKSAAKKISCSAFDSVDEKAAESCEVASTCTFQESFEETSH